MKCKSTYHIDKYVCTTRNLYIIKFKEKGINAKEKYVYQMNNSYNNDKRCDLHMEYKLIHICAKFEVSLICSSKVIDINVTEQIC